jgi:2-polyprenyl-3-methyl-5-hydroxy-6-metoxy-1,4-benzoquinol methylase
MAMNQETLEIRKRLFPGYTGKENFKSVWTKEFNELLGLNYSSEDFKNILRDCKVKQDFEKDLVDFGSEFYSKSKSFIFANAAYNFSHGFGIFQMLFKHYKEGKFLDYGGGAGNCNLIAQGGDYLDIPGEVMEFAKKRFVVKGVSVNIIQKVSDKYDFIVCSDVLEHVENAHEIAELLADSLNEEGKLLLTYSFGSSEENSTHLKKYNKGTGREILKILRDKGLSLIDKDFKGTIKIFQKKAK